MKRSFLSPIIEAYSDSLLGFIKFIRERYPFPTPDGNYPTFPQDHDEKPGSE